MEVGYKHGRGVVLWGWLMRVCQWHVLFKGKEQQNILSVASPLLLSFPHLFLGWIYGFRAFQVSAGSCWGFSGALQAPLASRSIKNFPSDWRKPHTCTSFRLAVGTFCHAGSSSLGKPLFFFSLAFTVHVVERGDYGRGGVEKRGLLTPDLILEPSAFPLSFPLPL